MEVGDTKLVLRRSLTQKSLILLWWVWLTSDSIWATPTCKPSLKVSGLDRLVGLLFWNEHTFCGAVGIPIQGLHCCIKPFLGWIFSRPHHLHLLFHPCSTWHIVSPQRNKVPKLWARCQGLHLLSFLACFHGNQWTINSREVLCCRFCYIYSSGGSRPRQAWPLSR